MKQTVMVILDGMQDIAYPALENKTPYESGRGESFRELEQSSATGRLRTTPSGFEADTQTCVLTLLGALPNQIPPGRSYIEALALGLAVGDDDIIMRCNFVQVDERGRLAVPCCNAPDDIAKALREAVAAQPGNAVMPVGSYKSLQIIAGERMSLGGLVTSTPHQHAMEPFEQLLPRGNALGERLAAFSRKQLEKRRPYTVLNWGAAVKDKLPGFGALHSGISGAMVSKTDAPMGIAAAMGMECPRIPTATGDTDTDLAAKVEATLELAARHDFVMLHIGGPDEATHRQDPAEKAAFIAKLDRECIAPLMERLPEGARMLVTCDHAALCKTAGHTEDPVDFWMWEKGKKLDDDLGERDGTQAVSLLLGNR